jgi:serine/threonine protein kinase
MNSPLAPQPGRSVPGPQTASDSVAGPDSTLSYARSGAERQDELRRRWQRGERVLVETYLRDDPALAHDEEALLDLIYCEFLVRGERGESPTLDEYLRRFPQHAARLQFLLAFDEAVCELIGSNSTTQSCVPEPTAPPAPVPDALPNVIAGKYRVIELLDRGGQAEVYRALHETLRRDVVIKLSRRPCPNDSAARQCFLAEGRILAELQHPNLAAVFDLDFHEDRAFLAMEYVRGQTLDQYARSHTISAREAAGLVAQIARAVAVAHQRGVVHRDLKPKNILIDATGRPRVIDFGLAQLRDAWNAGPDDTGHISGTLPFMPPEQASPATAADARTDVFALGAVLYYLLTGRALYSGKDTADLLHKAQLCEYDRLALEQPSIPPHLRAICLKALAPKPAERHANADALAEELQAFVQPPRRRLWLRGLVASLVLVAALPLGWYLFHVTQSNHSAALADVTPTLFVEVRENRDRAAIRPLRLEPTPRTGSEVKITARVPPGISASLFHIDAQGSIRKLESRGNDTTAALIAPSAAGKAYQLTGAEPASEFFLAVGRKDGRAVTEDEVRVALPPAAIRLPILPKDQYLRMMRGKVEWEPAARGLEEIDAPEWKARDQLDDIRQSLAQRFDYVEGILFTHR